MKNILTLLCILGFAQAAIAGGTMLFTTPQNSSGQNNWYRTGNSNYYTQTGYDSFYSDRNIQNPGRTKQTAPTTVTEQTYEKRIRGGYNSTYRTKQDKYYNHGGVKFGSGISNNGTTGRW